MGILGIYTLLAKLPLPKSYLGKILLAAFVGTHLPLLGLVAYLVANSTISSDLALGVLVVVFVATLVGFGATLYVIYSLLVPVSAASRARRKYRESGTTPSLPTNFTDQAGRLMADVQHTVNHLDGMIHSLEDISTMDPLTRLPNRRLFMHRLEQSLTQSSAEHEERRREHTEQDEHAKHTKQAEQSEQAGGKRAVLFVDLDNFKIVNDSLGHEAGDQVLVAVARRLNRCVRSGDTVARFGGDEFTVLLEDTSSREATRVARRIVDALREPLAISDQEIVLGCSVGLALTQEAVSEPQEPRAVAGESGELLRQADIALYRAKEGGGGVYVVFEAGMDVRLRERLEVEGELRRAVEREELVVYYQPIANLETGKIAGFEALLRWQHHEQGLLLPERFLSVAEESGLITSIGHWVLEEVSRQTARWWCEEYGDRIKTPLPPVNVNLSASQLERPEFAREVREIFQRNRTSLELLELEITESVAMNDDPSTLETIEDLRALGVGIVIDDFGTGYSSLGYLTRFPVDALKIDRTIVGCLDRDPKKEAVARAVVTLAHSLDYRVVAEGVETTSQIEYLRRLGCELGQGNLMWEPLPAG